MKHYFKYSILITLTLITLLTISAAQAVIPNIGTTNNANPFDSAPTAISFWNVGGPTDKGKMTDTDLATSGSFPLGGNQILNPTGPGFDETTGPWTNSWLFWADWPTHDGTTTVRENGALNKRATVTLTQIPTDTSGTVSSVRVYAVAKKTSGTATIGIRLMLRLGTTDSFSANTAVTTAFVLYSAIVARPGGGVWSWADINSLQAGVATTTTGTLTTVTVTQVYVEVVSTATTGYFEFNTFNAVPPQMFNIGFVDIKMKYAVPATLVDDTYRIEYSIDGITFNTLQAATSGVFDEAGTPQVRAFAQVARPGGGAWTFTDISTLSIRITATQGGGAWSGVVASFFDVWLTIYEPPLPPAASTAVSVQPLAVYGMLPGNTFFVDVYVQDVSSLSGYEFTMSFDPTMLTFIDAFSYWPWTDVVVTPGTGQVNLLATAVTPTSDTGFTGNSPMGRFYFSVDAWGTSKLDLPISKIGLPSGVPIPHATYPGWVASPHYMSFTTGILGARDPTVAPNNWHEEYPTYSQPWMLTSWNDTGLPTGSLSFSDQIDMTNATGWTHYFHVDVVMNSTIHYTFTAGGTGIGIAEPSPAAPEVPADPTASTWHQLYPVFSRTFAIDNWTDTVNDFVFGPGDEFGATYQDDFTTFLGHLDSVSTDIIISEQPVPPKSPGGTPEFPLGVEALMALVLAIPIVYIWRLRKTKPKLTQTNPKGLKP